MRHADSNELQAVIVGVIKASRLSERFRSLTLGAEGYDEDDVIRVRVQLRNLDEISDDEVDTLTSSIENAVTRYDDRFPSIRYSEP